MRAEVDKARGLAREAEARRAEIEKKLQTSEASASDLKEVRRALRGGLRGGLQPAPRDTRRCSS
eukprot:5944126-Prymnesium_polylepis.1